MPEPAKAMTLRLTPEQARQIQAVAAVDNVSVSDAIRAAIDAYVDARRRDKKFQKRLRRSLENQRQAFEELAS